MFRRGNTAVTCASQRRLYSHISRAAARGRIRFRWLVWRPKVYLGIQDSLDSTGWRGGSSLRGLLAPAARYREG